MAEYSTNTEELKGIANAIRAKGGTSATLEFPNEFKAAIEAIPTGGDLDALLDRSITAVDSGVTSIPRYGFDDCRQLVSARLPAVGVVPEYAFRNCRVLHSVDISAAAEIQDSGFYYCTTLPELSGPAVTAITGGDAFRHCRALTRADFPVLTSISGARTFTDTALTALILRAPTVCALTDPNPFEESPIAAGTGYIYVPAGLAEQYRTAPGWSTYAAQIRVIEDYPDITGGVV